MLELDNQLGMGTRTRPPGELAQAFVKFFRSKYKARLPLEDIQAQYALSTFQHLRGNFKEDPHFGLPTEELRMALRVLKNMGKDYQYQAHSKLARLLFEELKRRREVDTNDQEPNVPFHKDLLPFIQVLAQYGDALYARDLVERHWDDCLKNVEATPWSWVLKGFIQENKTEELHKTIGIMRKYNVHIDSKIHQMIAVFCASHQSDMEMTKIWYRYPIANGETPTNETDAMVLKLCISQDELEWGDPIFRSLIERTPEEKVPWDVIFQWAAAQGKSVDEVERMMAVMRRRQKERNINISQDIETINGLIAFANSKNDPYTAERYLALGQKLGYQPNAKTFLLQLDYRIKVGDLGGARTAYARLQEEGNAAGEDIPLINKLLVGLCADKPQNYDAIMSLVEDLGERKARFEPETVAALSSLHLQRGEMEDLVDLLNTHAFHYGLEQRGLVGNVLVKHCLDHSTPTSRAWETYNILRKVFSETDIPTRTTLMNNFFSRKRSDMATHVFGHMRQQEIKSLRPTISTYAACLSGIAKAGALESLETVHNMMKLDSDIEPNTQLYNALMLAYTGCGEPRIALTFWEDIVHSREGPTYASIQIALMACEKAPFGERTARNIWARLKRFEIEVTREIYAAYVGAMAGHSLFDECVRLIDGAEKEVGYKPDALLLGTFYNAIPEAKRQQVKEWAWEAYAKAYEELLKLGQYEITKSNGVGEDAFVYSRESFFNIGPIGRDVEA